MPDLPKKAEGRKMILTLAGSNNFALKRRLNQLIAEFVSEHGDLALEKLDGEEVAPQAVLDAIQNLPFLSAKKMVVVRSLGANKQASEQIEQIISSAVEGVDVIFYEPQIDKRTSYFKVLKAQTTFEELGDLDSRGLAKWLVDEAGKKDSSLSQADANYLISRVGPNQVLLSNELEKLSIYNPKITRETIDLLTEKTPQSKIFDLLDAVFSGNKKRAVKLYDEQRIQKVEPQEIIAMFAWQLRIISAIKLGKGKNSAEIAKDLGVGPYPVQKAMGLAGKIDGRKLGLMISDLLEIDISGKTSPVDLDEMLKSYIVSL